MIDIETHVPVHVDLRLCLVPVVVILIWQNFFQIPQFTFIPPLFKKSLLGEVLLVGARIFVSTRRDIIQYQIIHRGFLACGFGSGFGGAVSGCIQIVNTSVVSARGPLRLYLL